MSREAAIRAAMDAMGCRPYETTMERIDPYGTPIGWQKVTVCALHRFGHWISQGCPAAIVATDAVWPHAHNAGGADALEEAAEEMADFPGAWITLRNLRAARLDPDRSSDE